MSAERARCPSCHGVMLEVDGCSAVVQLNAERFGHEPHFADGSLEPAERCWDCAARVGHHHHANCLQAMCMICGDQAVACDHAGENGDVL